MSAEACAALVAKGDPDRWRSAMTAPVGARPGLMALYAFNIEIARAPYVASEPMLAQIRLQWWQDAVDEIFAGNVPRRHEVVEPLAEAIRAGDLPARLFAETIAARLRDAGPAPHDDRTGLDLYLSQTAGHVMELAASVLGVDGPALGVVREFAQGAGIAAYLAAIPGLEARGRITLPPGVSPDALAREGQVLLGQARARRAEVPREALPALLAGWRADGVLRRAVARPEDVGTGRLAGPEASARADLVRRALTGRW